jgi:hypothetical protein
VYQIGLFADRKGGAAKLTQIIFTTQAAALEVLDWTGYQKRRRSCSITLVRGLWSRDAYGVLKRVRGDTRPGFALGTIYHLHD